MRRIKNPEDVLKPNPMASFMSERFSCVVIFETTTGEGSAPKDNPIVFRVFSIVFGEGGET